MKNSSEKEKSEIAVFGGGCFWCLEAVFARLDGVISVFSGYAGGTVSNPTYEEICSGKTGHAEVMKIEYDPKKISYESLLAVFFEMHDPTTLNRQGADTGTQYRSIVLFSSEDQKKQAEEIIKKLNSEKVFENPIVTEIRPLEIFYPAEDYHQKYFEKNPDQAYCRIHITPKVAKLREIFGKLIT